LKHLAPGVDKPKVRERNSENISRESATLQVILHNAVGLGVAKHFNKALTWHKVHCIQAEN
jgi:hypothetical protein